MAVDIYSKTAWNNGTAPSLSKTQLDHIETGIKNNNTAIISLQSVQVECENYASEAEASKIASASSATASASSALSALTSANTAKTEADRAVAVAGVDIATDLVAGLVRGGGNVEVDANGDMNVPIANNLTTTASGYVLDARQGKALNDSLNGKQQSLSTAIKSTTLTLTYIDSNTLKAVYTNAKQILPVGIGRRPVARTPDGLLCYHYTQNATSGYNNPTRKSVDVKATSNGDYVSGHLLSAVLYYIELE